MTGITRMPGMTRLQLGVYLFLNKKFKDIFSRTQFPFSRIPIRDLSRFVVFTFL